MTKTLWDTIIVGQGLAGTTLAWHLHLAGERVLLIDPEIAFTTSKIAAGLITPITGQRLGLGWEGDDFLPVAQAFYVDIEKHTGQRFFHTRTAVRLFETVAERELWPRRRAVPAIAAHVVEPQRLPLLDPEIGDDSGGGFEMRTAQLDVAAYLDASRAQLPYLRRAVDWNADVAFDGDKVHLSGETARRVISCEGYGAARNPHFGWVPYKPAQGDILTVRFARRLPPTPLHRGIWVAPTSDPDVFRVGSTYDWSRQDQVPSDAARQEIERRLRAFVRVPHTVVGHAAAVRPIITSSKSLFGLHPKHPRLGYFNGLGSKGTLRAPLFARMFSEHLMHGTPIPPALNLQKFWPPYAT